MVVNSFNIFFQNNLFTYAIKLFSNISSANNLNKKVFLIFTTVALVSFKFLQDSLDNSSQLGNKFVNRDIKLNKQVVDKSFIKDNQSKIITTAAIALTIAGIYFTFPTQISESIQEINLESLITNNSLVHDFSTVDNILQNTSLEQSFIRKNLSTICSVFLVALMGSLCPTRKIINSFCCKQSVVTGSFQEAPVMFSKKRSMIEQIPEDPKAQDQYHEIKLKELVSKKDKNYVEIYKILDLINDPNKKEQLHIFATEQILNDDKYNRNFDFHGLFKIVLGINDVELKKDFLMGLLGEILNQQANCDYCLYFRDVSLVLNRLGNEISDLAKREKLYTFIAKQILNDYEYDIKEIDGIVKIISEINDNTVKDRLLVQLLDKILEQEYTEFNDPRRYFYELFSVIGHINNKDDKGSFLDNVINIKLDKTDLIDDLLYILKHIEDEPFRNLIIRKLAERFIQFENFKQKIPKIKNTSFRLKIDAKLEQGLRDKFLVEIYNLLVESGELKDILGIINNIENSLKRDELINVILSNEKFLNSDIIRCLEEEYESCYVIKSAILAKLST